MQLIEIFFQRIYCGQKNYKALHVVDFSQQYTIISFEIPLLQLDRKNSLNQFDYLSDNTNILIQINFQGSNILPINYSLTSGWNLLRSGITPPPSPSMPDLFLSV
ncbi:hypothetical protein V5J35_002446 [Endozoicomonas sp. NE40]|uniref:Uncharacterized protein n=1 Tax=Endozoicomonas lisbonensis TaxID=3120522 RepID=A0ABV2SHK4_9GAMM